MNDLSSMRRETRYGMPAADQILFNRHYVLGYSYYFRQAKWALEIIDPGKKDIDRINNFRPDYRIPEAFRADLADYKHSNFDRGHLVASANKNELKLQNSETFLLSNMSPQAPYFNRGIWRKLESAIRELDAQEDIWETFVICGPIFYFDKPVDYIGAEDNNKVSIPIPNAYFKSVLTEDRRGNLDMWSFIMSNEKSDEDLTEFLVPTSKVEMIAGINLWELLTGTKMDKERTVKQNMW